MTLKVTVWNEYRHEKSHEEVRKVYPDGLHAPIADHLTLGRDDGARGNVG